MPLKKDVLEIVNAEVGRRKWKDTELARRAGWTQSRMSRALNGVTKIGLEDLEVIFGALGVGPEVIVQALRAAVGEKSASPVPGVRSQETNPSDREARLERLLDGAYAAIEELKKGMKP